MAKGPIKSTAAAKKARRLAVGSGRVKSYIKDGTDWNTGNVRTKPGAPKILAKPLSKREEKKGAKKELKSSSSAVRRTMTASTYDHKNASAAATRANAAVDRAVKAGVSTRASKKAVDKGDKAVLKGNKSRANAAAKTAKKTGSIKKNYNMTLD